MSEEKRAIKESFERVKKDILMLGQEVVSLRNEIIDIKSLIQAIETDLKSFKIAQINQNNTSTHNSTHPIKTSTNTAASTHNSTDTTVPKALKYPNLSISIGNQGASTDRQTDRQTDSSTHNFAQNDQNKHILDNSLNQNIIKEKADTNQNIDNSISEASEILDSLDNLKKQIRLQFKTITQQEMLVFSTIYQLEDQYPESVDYKKISQKLGLSESSIRDYVQRLINKGIPIHKVKINNKKIILKISQKLRKIAPLETILRLREI